MFEFKNNKNGLILVYVFMIMAALSSVAYVFVQGNINDTRLFSSFENEKKARWLAYGGIEKAKAMLQETPSFRGGMPDEVLDNGRILVEITDNPGGKIIIRSTGISGDEKVEKMEEVHYQVRRNNK